MGKLMVVMMIFTAYVMYVDHQRNEARRDEQMRTVYTATCNGESFDVRFRSKLDGDLMTLDGRRVQLTEGACVVVEKYIEEDVSK